MTSTVSVAEAQRDMRKAFLGGFAGQLVSGLIWLASAAAATLRSPRAGMVVLIVCGMFIFPLTQLVLRLMGKANGLQKGNPLNALGMQVAFTVPLAIPVILAATAYRRDWFYPAFMVVVGAHYLPFIFLYGMWQFGVLGGLLIGWGLVLALYAPGLFTLGGWVTGLLLVAFAFVGLRVSQRG